MRISTKRRYAVRMRLDIATHQGDGYGSMKDIAARQQISGKYPETFTVQMAAADIPGIRRLSPASESIADCSAGGAPGDGRAAACRCVSGMRAKPLFLRRFLHVPPPHGKD